MTVNGGFQRPFAHLSTDASSNNKTETKNMHHQRNKIDATRKRTSLNGNKDIAENGAHFHEPLSGDNNIKQPVTKGISFKTASENATVKSMYKVRSISGRN